MKIAIAQTHPAIGDTYTNVGNHMRMIRSAVKSSVECIIFPELSITGYEPTQASEMALKSDDRIFDKFQELSDDIRIAIGFGIPIVTSKGVCIGMALFRPNTEKQFYFKKFLHSDEEEFFVPGENLLDFSINNTKIALAICYEISVEEHTQNAFKHMPDLFVASVIKSKKTIDEAHFTLSKMAKTYNTPVLMSNSIGISEGEKCAGLSSVWDENGDLLAQLSDQREGILVFDIDSKKIEIKEY